VRRARGIWCFVTLAVSVAVAATTVRAMSMFAGYNVAMPTDSEVISIEASTHRLRDLSSEKEPSGLLPPPLDDVYDRYQRRFTDAPAISRILTVLRGEVEGWSPYIHTQPGTNSFLRIFDGKGLSFSFHFNLHRCRDGLFLYSGQRDGNRDTAVVTKHFGPDRCTMLMTALDVPVRFWKQP